MKPQLVFDQGYDIDSAYAEADRHAVGSDAWHYWMDKAARLAPLDGTHNARARSRRIADALDIPWWNETV